VGNLMRGGRLGRAKPILPRIETLRAPWAETASRVTVSPRGKAHWPICAWRRRGETPGEAEAQESNAPRAFLTRWHGVADPQSA
jgi:hypothetical protein